jgi:acyl transferase domain-containing protein
MHWCWRPEQAALGTAAQYVPSYYWAQGLADEVYGQRIAAVISLNGERTVTERSLRQCCSALMQCPLVSLSPASLRATGLSLTRPSAAPLS